MANLSGRVIFRCLSSMQEALEDWADERDMELAELMREISEKALANRKRVLRLREGQPIKGRAALDAAKRIIKLFNRRGAIQISPGVYFTDADSLASDDPDGDYLWSDYWIHTSNGVAMAIQNVDAFAAHIGETYSMQNIIAMAYHPTSEVFKG